MNSRFLITLVVFAWPLGAMAKPLYITVPRTFASSEQAQVSVSFAGKEPVELRILQPENLEQYIGDQANLRRAYVPPSTALNPGRFLAQALNKVSSPATFLFRAISPRFRKEVSPSLPYSVPSPGQMSRLREGPKKLVGLPPGMRLVKSEWLNLDLGGGEVDFNVPGFDAWRAASAYQERQLTLPKLPPGLYVLQVVQNVVEGQVTLVITDQTVQVKQSDGRVLVRVASRDQQPVPEVKVTLYAGGKNVQSASTNKNGEAFLDSKEPKLLVLSRIKDDIAVVDTDFYSTLAVAPDVFIYSDRPIYRAGDEVQFRGVVRKPSSFLAELLLPKKRSVDVSMQVPGAELVKTRVSIDSYGSFDGSLRVPAHAAEGVVRLVAHIDQNDKDSGDHQAEARVQEYLKPTFYLEMTTAQETITPGGKLTAKVRARRYAGGVPAHAKYEFFLYRTQLDTPAWIDDLGRQGSALSYGNVPMSEGRLSIPKRVYSSLAVHMENASPDANPWDTAASFDGKGEALIAIDVPALEEGEEHLSFRYALSVKARDDQASEALTSKSFYHSDTDVVAQVTTSAKVFKKGSEGTLSVRAGTLTGKVYGEAEGTLSLRLRDGSGSETKLEDKAVKTGPDGILRFPLPTAKVGTVIAHLTLKDKKGALSEGEANALVIGDNSEVVADVAVLTTEALGEVLEPGAEAELAALLPSGWGPQGKDKGRVWVTLSGAGIYATEMVALSGRTLIYKFPIEKRFGSVVYAAVSYPTQSGRWDERAVAFRIVPRERVLTVELTPAKSEVAPLGEQRLQLRVSNAAGEGVPAQVSVGVVDKAIYTLQAELRPGIVDFFYPFGRNNVSTFYSIDFQAYGYGEQLARLKQGLRPFEFAAVKAPSKRARELDRDTAYWNAKVITGSDGTAKVAFTMPSNQTLWVITAVAADSSGRFGEGRAEFASRGNLSLGVAMPQFMREGDEATGSVRVSLAEAKSGKVSLQLAQNDAISGVKQDFELAKGDEKVLPFNIKAKTKGSITALLSAKLSGDALSDVKRLAVRPSAIQEDLRVSAWGGGELALPAAGDSLVGRAQLSLIPGSVDTALASVDELLGYPYGCLEQLVATTVPNIALYSLLSRNGLRALDPSSQELLQLARSRAQNGLDRILALAQKGGGFTWFSGDATPSVPLTLVALDGLSYAIDAGMVSKDASQVQESITWLSKRDDLSLADDATRAYVLARLEGVKQAPRARALVDKVEPLSELYALAITALAAQNAGIANEAGMKERLASIVQRSRTLLAQNADFNSDAFFAYPLRAVGLAAIVAHAASGVLSDAELKDARKRFMLTMASPELSTFDRSTLILHHLWLIDRDAAHMKAMNPPVADAKGQMLVLKAKGYGLETTLPAGAVSASVGRFDGVATLQAKVNTPLPAVQELAQGMSITRTYYLLRDQGRKKLADNEAVTVGDLVYVELGFDADPEDKWRKQRSAYYVVEDSVPAGFVVESEDKIYRAEPFGLPLAHAALRQRAFTPESVRLFFEEPVFWSASAHTIGYVMRAQFAGRFQVPPAAIADMYAAQVKARTKATVFAVDGGK